MSFSTEILNQIPEIVCCVNEKHEFTYINQTASATFGFKANQKILGTKFPDIPCQAATILAEKWIKQNEDIFQYKQPLKILDIGLYSNDKLLTLLTCKSIIVNPADNQSSVYAHCTRLTSNLLTTLSINLIRSDEHYHLKNNHHRSYAIANEFSSSKLSPRELECLFYLVRGKSAKNIGKILSLSKRTVEFYLTNIKHKLECHSKADLIELCVESSFTSFIPQQLLKRLNVHKSVIL